MPQSSTPIISTGFSSRCRWAIAPLLLLITATVLVTGYLHFLSWKAPATPPSPLHWDGAQLNMIEGQGHKEQDNLIINNSSDRGVAIATVSPVTIDATNYPTVRLEAPGVQPGTPLLFLWRHADNPSDLFTMEIPWQDRRLLPLRVANDAAWRGKIAELGLVVTSPITNPVTIDRITLVPANLRPSLYDLVVEWMTFESWSGSSINFLYGGPPRPTLPLLPAVVVLVLTAFGLYLALAGLRLVVFTPSVLIVFVLSGWLVLDTRWQFNLMEQLSMTFHDCAGKSWEERRKSAEDGDLFSFAQQIKEQLPATPVRILFFSDLDYLQGRGAYHLYPHNVYKSGALPSPDKFRAGDYVALYQKTAVRYDPSSQTLQWGAGQSLPVEILLGGKDYALLRVR